PPSRSCPRPRLRARWRRSLPRSRHFPPTPTAAFRPSATPPAWIWTRGWRSGPPARPRRCCAKPTNSRHAAMWRGGERLIAEAFAEDEDRALRAKASYLERYEEPRAAALWIAYADEQPDNLERQRQALSSRSVSLDPEWVQQA